MISQTSFRLLAEDGRHWQAYHLAKDERDIGQFDNRMTLIGFPAVPFWSGEPSSSRLGGSTNAISITGRRRNGVSEPVKTDGGLSTFQEPNFGTRE
jgi:hypothetical protein